MDKKVFLTTSIPYVNGAPHIGFSLEAIQSDTLVRFYRENNYQTYFLSGTDENAIKNVESAEKNNVTTQQWVDLNAQKFLQLKTDLNLTYDQFIKTSSQKHHLGAQHFWQLCQADIYKKKYTGLYCVGCENFYEENEFPENICPLHNRKLEKVVEENYFFRLSKYQKQLEEIIEKNILQIYPKNRKKETLQFIKKGLRDFSISRPTERTKGWGIPVPDDASQMIYVWFDALTNYITALGIKDNDQLFQDFWINNSNKIHVIGKDIFKFHAIYWPAMLLSAKLPLPNKLFIHGFLTSGGKKMSKTLGNVIDPFAVVKQYGVDAVRYYLLREIPSLDDGDFSHSRMKEIYNTDLANELGNLVSRITTLGEKDGINIAIEKKPTAYFDLITAFEFNKVLEDIWNKIKKINKEINDFAPWKKTPAERKDFLTKTILEINYLSQELLPFIPATAKKINQATQGKISKISPLFPKLL